jgi:hypothetical protein
MKQKTDNKKTEAESNMKQSQFTQFTKQPYTGGTMKRNMWFYLPIAILAIAALLLAGCEKSTELGINSPSNVGAGMLQLAGPNGHDVVLNSGYPQDNGNGTYTWQWTVSQGTSPAAISHIGFKAGECFGASNVLFASATNGSSTVPGVWVTSDNSLNNGQGTCKLGSVAYLKFNIGGTVTITVIVNQDYSVGNMTWVAKAGNNCQIASVANGIGCFKISGTVRKIDCNQNTNQSDTTAYANATVSAGSITTTTDSDGKYTLQNVPSGTYSVCVGSVCQSVSVGPSQSGVNFLIDLRPIHPTLFVPFCPGDDEGCPSCPPPQCTYTQGYWKTHGPIPKGQNSNMWPINTAVNNDSLMLGSVNYSDLQLLQIFNTPVRGNGWISLAHQLIAAKLNVLNGADPSAVANTITAADNLIGSTNLLGSAKISTNATAQLKSDLGAYNEGHIGPGHCN